MSYVVFTASVLTLMAVAAATDRNKPFKAHLDLSNTPSAVGLLFESHRDLTRSARDEGGGWEWGGEGAGVWWWMGGWWWVGVGWGGGEEGENAGGGGTLLKSSSQAKSGESVGHHQHVSPRQQILQLPYLYFAMASSAISIIKCCHDHS